MSCLAEFDLVRNNLKTLRKDNITALHKFVFNEEGDRSNRSRLRKFEGFNFDESQDEYRAKCRYVNQTLTKEDLTSICITLGLKYDAQDMINHIFRNLKKGNLLAADDDEGASDDDADEDDADDDDADEENADDDRLYNKNGKDATGKDAKGKDAKGADEDFQSFARSIESLSVTQRPKPVQVPRFALSFRDVEDSIKSFDGSNTTSIETWINDFEETAAILHWDELQTFVFAKKSLQGLAKLYIAGSKGITTWPKLKNALLEEFKMKVNGRQIHMALMERTMNKDETVIEYLYKMKEIASRGDLVDADLIRYVIDGIKDTHLNKQMLYGARDLRAFKEKLLDYEVYAAKVNTSNERRQNNNEVRNFEQKPAMKKTNIRDKNIQSSSNNNYNRCYNCGESGHLASNCRNKGKGAKCFRCNEYGHVARDCKGENNSDKIEEVRCVSAVKDNMLKKIKIADKEELTVKGLEAEINKMNASHQAEITGLKRLHQQQLLAALEETRRKHEQMENYIRESAAQDRELILEKERTAIRQRFDRQMEQERKSFDKHREKLSAEFVAEREKLENELRNKESDFQIKRQDIQREKQLEMDQTVAELQEKMSRQNDKNLKPIFDLLQQAVNSTFHRSIKTTPFELMIGKPMRTKDDITVRKAIEEEMIRAFDEGRNELRQTAKEQIVKVQNENRHSYNLRRKPAPVYKVGDTIAIKRTQFGPGLKLKAKYLGPYQTSEIKPNDTYDVLKLGDGEGPKVTTTCAEFNKRWPGDDPFEA